MRVTHDPVTPAANLKDPDAVLKNYLDALPRLPYQWKVMNGGEIRAKKVKPQLSPLGAYCKAQTGVELEPNEWRRVAKLTGMLEGVTARIYLAEEFAEGYDHILRQDILRAVGRVIGPRPSEQWRKKRSRTKQRNPGPRVPAAAPRRAKNR